MAYIGKNPKVKSIVSEGDTFANLNAEPRKAGRLVYATDQQKYYFDNGTTLSPVDTDTQYVPQNIAIGALDVDWSAGDVFYKSISSDVAFTFSNDSNGATIIVIIENTDASAHAITWPVGVKTPLDYDGNVEAVTESIFTFVKSNGSIYLVEVKEVS